MTSAGHWLRAAACGSNDQQASATVCCPTTSASTTWPILQTHVAQSVAVSDRQTQQAMKWLYEQHGLRTEPSGAIATAALLHGIVQPQPQGDIVVVISGRNVDEAAFRKWIADHPPVTA